MQVHTSNIRVTYEYIRITYEYIRVTYEYTGVPNDSFDENPPYGLLNITRVSLRQSCLIFNFPGKKIPSKQDFEVIGLPASARR